MNNIQRNFKQKAGLRKGYNLGGEVDPLSMANDRLRDINRMSGLSQRQRGTALAGVADKMAEQGATTDLKSLMGSGYTALSSRQKLGLGNAQFGNDLAAMQANQPKPAATPAAPAVPTPAIAPMADPRAGNEASDYWGRQQTLNSQISDLQKGYLDRAKTDGTLTGVSGSATGSNGVTTYLATGGETGDKYVLSAEATKKLGLRANVRGPGGPTDDMVPGEKYGAPGTALSDGEVIGEPSELLDAISKKLTGKEPGPTMVQRKGLRAGLAFSGKSPLPVEDVYRINRGLPQLAAGQPLPVDEVMQANKVFRAAPPAAPAYNPGAAPLGISADSGKLYEMGKRAGLAAKNAPGLGATAKTVAGTALRNAPVLYGAHQTLNDPLKFEPEDPASEASTLWAKNKSVAANVGDVATKGLDFLTMPLNWVGDKLGVTEDDGSPMEYDTYNKFFRRGMAELGGKPVPKKTFDVVQPTTDAERAAAVTERAAAEVKADPSKGLRQALTERVYGEGTGVPEGAQYSRQGDSNAHTLTWNSKENGVFANDRPLADGREAFKLKAQPQDGGGIVSIRQKDGSFKNVILGPSEYTKADGTKTANHRESTRYAEGLRDAENIRRQDDVLRKMRAEDDAFNPEITDPNVRNQGLRRLASIAEGEKNAATQAATRSASTLALAKYNQDERKLAADIGNKTADNQRAAENDLTARTDDLLKNLASVDGKIDNQKYARLQKYAGQFKHKPGTKHDEKLRDLVDNLAVDQLFEDAGRHMLSSEGPSSGEAVLPKVERTGFFQALAHGKLGGQESFVDPRTKRRIYLSDALANLSPNQQEILKERVAKYKQ